MKSEVKAYFLSDIHLESEKDSNFFVLKKLLIQLLKDPDCTHLFLMGDIFDLWVADHFYFKEKFSQTLKALHDLKNKGVEIHYFEGNHDLDLKPYFEPRGVVVHESAKIFELFGKKFLLEHGDQMDPDDRGYLFLRWLLRTKAMRAIGRGLPGSLVQRIGNSMSSTSRRYTDRMKEGLGDTHTDRQKRIFEKIRSHVERQVQQGKEFDFFVSGHVHEEFQEVLEFDGHRVEVINLGSWLGNHKPFGLFTSEKGFQIGIC